MYKGRIADNVKASSVLVRLAREAGCGHQRKGRGRGKVYIERVRYK
jgi:hypothetical protein